MAEQSFGWRQPVAALIAFASFAGPLVIAAGWMIGGADGPVERQDPVQVPAFVAEESGTRDQARTLVLDSDSTARVGYTLVRGSGARLGDAESAAADGENSRLDKVVANLVAGSGADQADQLGKFAVRYVLVHKGAPREVTRVLDATPGLSRLSQQDGSALWRVDQEVARATIAAASGPAQPVAAGPVEIHTTVPAGSDGRVLRLADTAAEGWTATLDGKPLTRTTVDGWAQGFRLPASGGRLDVTYDDPVTHTVWLWAQGFLAVVLVVLALPGRRRDIDDDLPEEPAVPAQAVAGEGRRARRLRAQAEAEEPGRSEEFPSPPRRRHPSPSRTSSPTATTTRPPTRAPSTAVTATSSTRAPSSTRRARTTRRTRRTRTRAASTTRTRTAVRNRGRTTRPRTTRRTSRVTTPRTTRRSSSSRRRTPLSAPTGVSSEPHDHLPDRGHGRARRHHRIRLAHRAGRLRGAHGQGGRRTARGAHEPAVPGTQRLRSRRHVVHLVHASHQGHRKRGQGRTPARDGAVGRPNGQRRQDGRQGQDGRQDQDER